MTRTNRQWDPNHFDHVVMRGNNRQNIFSNRIDIAVLLKTLHYANTKHPFTVIAYCIMNNHFHLLIRSPEVPLGKVMGLINKQYSNYYRKKYNYTGFLYESRYFARMVPNPIALLSVSAYIHRNPVATKKPIVERMENYPFSSFRLYHRNSESPFPFLDLTILPSLLPEPYGKTHKGYTNFCEDFQYNEELKKYIKATSLNQ